MAKSGDRSRPAGGTRPQRSSAGGAPARAGRSPETRDHGGTSKRDGRTARPLPSGFEARRLAAEVVRQVTEQGRALNQALPAVFADADRQGLEPRDRAFARAIIMATLRRFGEIEALIAGCLERPLPIDRGGHQAVLATAVAQLLHLRSAPHAAINVAVELTRANRASARYDKLTNAVLRRIARDAALADSGSGDVDGGAVREAVPDAAPLDDPAVRQNVPDWLWHRWSSTYGEETALAIARASLQEPALDLSVRGEPEAWAQRLGGVVLPTGTVRLLHEGRIETLAGFLEGQWWVQDAAASVPALLLGDVRDRHVVELCASPGGKTAALAVRGATVTAVDLPGERAALLADTKQRLSLELRIVAEDALLWETDETFDDVLLDAPCSATGTIRRHPDILRLNRKADLGPLIDIQTSLLERAARLVRPGGRLVYCTCSLEPEEGEAQIAAFLQAYPEFRRLPVTAAELGGRSDWIDAHGDVRTLPHLLPMDDPALSGIDGFYAARLERLRESQA